MNSPTTPAISSPPSRRKSAIVEIALIFLTLFLFAGSPPPGDDEVHYLGKAKQYWNPEWLAGDHFLETPDAHVVFNWAIGWVTLFFSLEASAWIGRCAAWLLLAIAWQRFSFAIVPQRYASLLTMALFLVLQQYGTAAREWIVGGVEAKCFAWALVLFALEQLVRTTTEPPNASLPGATLSKVTSNELWRWKLVWPLLGLASAFHVLVGGWAVVAALFTWLITKHRPTLVSMLPTLVLGGAISLLGVLPALRLSSGVSPEVMHEAQRIYVFERLSHHLVIHEFPWRYRLQFLAVFVAWLVICWLTRTTTRSRPLRKFIVGSLLIALVGIVIDQATLASPDLAAALLRFYWFRLADMMAPIGLAMGLVEGALAMQMPTTKSTGEKVRKRLLSQVAVALLCVVPMGLIGWRAAERWFDRRSGAELQARIAPDDIADWRAACDWIKRQTPAVGRFLTPPNYQCFRWHAERSEVVSWKDIPQNAAGIVEWRDRLQASRGWWASLKKRGFTLGVERRLKQLAHRYNVQYLIVPHSVYAQPLALTPLYSNAQGADESQGFTVYWIPPPGDADPVADERSH